jgi:hypothetical protein
MSLVAVSIQRQKQKTQETKQTRTLAEMAAGK